MRALSNKTILLSLMILLNTLPAFASRDALEDQAPQGANPPRFTNGTDDNIVKVISLMPSSSSQENLLSTFIVREEIIKGPNFALKMRWFIGTQDFDVTYNLEEQVLNLTYEERPIYSGRSFPPSPLRIKILDKREEWTISKDYEDFIQVRRVYGSSVGTIWFDPLTPQIYSSDLGYQALNYCPCFARDIDSAQDMLKNLPKLQEEIFPLEGEYNFFLPSRAYSDGLWSVYASTDYN